MTELRTRIGALSQISSENPEGSVEVDAWNRRNNEYHAFCNIAMPLYESRLWRLGNVSPHTLRGLARKAEVIKTEIVGFSDDASPATCVLRSIFQDITNMMGEEG